MSNRPDLLSARKSGKPRPSGIARSLNDGTLRDAGYIALRNQERVRRT